MCLIPDSAQRTCPTHGVERVLFRESAAIYTVEAEWCRLKCGANTPGERNCPDSAGI